MTEDVENNLGIDEIITYPLEFRPYKQSNRLETFQNVKKFLKNHGFDLDKGLSANEIIIKLMEKGNDEILSHLLLIGVASIYEYKKVLEKLPYFMLDVLDKDKDKS
jgi:hypothetical protein